MIINDVIDYVNEFEFKAKITNISVDTWDEAFQTDWKRSGDYATPTCCNVSLVYERFSITYT